MTVDVYEAADRDGFCRRAAELIGIAAEEAVTRRGRFLLALTGGRTVQPVYRYLAAGASADLRQILARRTEFFWGDERWVGSEHPDSNQGLAGRLLLDPLAVAAERRHPVATSLPEPAAGARVYEETLRETFGEDLDPEGFPAFDCILLGLGPDGHLASLFPGSPLLNESRRWVGKAAPPELAPRVARVTLTLPVLNRAHHVLVLAAGEERAKLARRVIERASGCRNYPACLLAPAGKLTWLLASGTAEAAQR